MRFFLCSLDGIILGLPSENIAKITAAPRTQTALCETEGGMSFISLPVLLGKDTPAPHGMEIKGAGGPEPVVLLVPRIDTDLDISAGDIKALPESIKKNLRCFAGAVFTEKDLILLVDMKELLNTALRGSHD
jgi:hypothetical protein